MDKIKFRAKVLKEILDGKRLVSNMWNLFSQDELPDFILEYYLKIGILNVKEDEPTRRWNTLIVTAFKENREAVEEWMESMKLYSDSASANTFEHGATIEEHDIDIEKSYIKHLEALTDL